MSGNNNKVMTENELRLAHLEMRMEKALSFDHYSDDMLCGLEIQIKACKELISREQSKRNQLAMAM